MILGVAMVASACSGSVSDVSPTSTVEVVTPLATNATPLERATATGILVSLPEGNFAICADLVRSPCVAGVWISGDLDADQYLAEDTPWGRRSAGLVEAQGELTSESFEVSSLVAVSERDSDVLGGTDFITLDSDPGDEVPEHPAIFRRGIEPSIASLYAAQMCGSSLIEPDVALPDGCEEVTTSLGLIPAHWWVESADGNRVRLVATESVCSTGELPGNRLYDPVVVETDQDVTIHVLIAAPMGQTICQPNPSFELVVLLESDLGDRRILGESTFELPDW